MICGIFQNPKFISEIADELIIMKNGKVLTSGNFSQVINTSDKEVSEQIESLFEQAASFDGNILDILTDSGDNPFFVDTDKMKD